MVTEDGHAELGEELTIEDWKLYARSFLKHHEVFHPECACIYLIKKPEPEKVKIWHPEAGVADDPHAWW